MHVITVSMGYRVVKVEFLAHRIFNLTPIYEVCDLPYRQADVDFINVRCSSPAPELVNRYLSIVQELAGGCNREALGEPSGISV